MRTITDISSLYRGNLYRSLEIAASGLTAQRQQMDAIASNIANQSVTNVDGNGSPYLRRQVVMSPDPRQTFAGELRRASLRMNVNAAGHIAQASSKSVRTEPTPLVAGTEIEIPNARLNVVYDPSHPDADVDGFVVYPDINPVEEMVDLMTASRAYDANITVINAAQEMITRSLDI